MRVAVKFQQGSMALGESTGSLGRQQAGPILVQRLLTLFAPAILIGAERGSSAGVEVVPLADIDPAKTIVINMDVIDSGQVWQQLRTRGEQPMLMNFLWWNLAERQLDRVETALLGLSIGLFPTFANSERTAEEAQDLVRSWMVADVAAAAQVRSARLGVHLSRVRPDRPSHPPVVLYPAIYVSGRKRPWDFIDVVSAVAEEMPIQVHMRLHDKQVTAQAAMEMSTKKWAEVGPLLERDEYWEALAGTTAFLATAAEESYGLEYVEALVSGAIGVFPDRAWAHQLLPDGYPFLYRDLTEAKVMLRDVLLDPAAARHELDLLVDGTFLDWVRGHHDDAAFNAEVTAAVRTWFAWGGTDTPAVSA